MEFLEFQTFTEENVMEGFSLRCSSVNWASGPIIGTNLHLLFESLNKKITFISDILALVFSVLNKHTAFIVLHTNSYCTFIKLPSMRIIWHSERTSAVLETSCRLLNELARPLFYQLISARRKSSNSLKQSWATFSKLLHTSEQRTSRWSRSHILPSHVFKSTLGLLH